MKEPEEERLVLIALSVLEGVWGSENEAGGALGLTKQEIARVRKLMHEDYDTLTAMLPKPGEKRDSDNQ